MSKREKYIERLKRVIHIAHKLKWVEPPNPDSYWWMQGSEVEKCMLAMVDDFEMKRLEEWLEDVESGRKKPVSYSEYRAKQYDQLCTFCHKSFPAKDFYEKHWKPLHGINSMGI